jgi:branched-chain amino acid transport system substrate-binding protein
MKNSIRASLLTIGLLMGSTGLALSAEPLKIGVMNDQTGIFSDLAGPGSVIAAQMAVEDAGGEVLGRKIEVLVADHQNKPDVGATIARRWYEADNVQAIFDIPVSSVGLAVQNVARNQKRIVAFSGSTSSELIGKACSPTGFQWTFNTVSAAKGTASAILKDGGDTWFFVSTDYAFGHALERDASAVVEEHKGKVLGTVRHPLGTTDFASYLLAAQASKAKVIALASSGSDLINVIKQADEFGISAGGQKVAALQTFITDTHSLGLEKAKGLLLTSAFYWDLDDATRAWSRRFGERNKGRMPTMVQAGVYSAVAHYIKSVAKAGTDDGVTVAKTMHEIPVNDFMTHNARVRNDGWVLRDLYLFQVKTPAESKAPWDYYRLIRPIPAADAAPPETMDCKGAQ